MTNQNEQDTLHLYANREPDLDTAAHLLSCGELVALPTETVYGLAAIATNNRALEQVFAAKGRPNHHPLILHISHPDAISAWTKRVPHTAHVLAQAFWPGPLTLILPKADHVSPLITGGQDTIALRVPGNTAFRNVLARLDQAVVAPSANPHKRISPTTADHVLQGLSGRIAAVLDDGPCEVGIESTILDLTQSQPTVLRLGHVSSGAIERVIGESVSVPSNHNVAVPGNMKAHYQPNTRTLLKSPDDISAHKADSGSKQIGVLHFSDLANLSSFKTGIRLPNIPKEYAAGLYAALYELDSGDLDEIWVESPSDGISWQAVQDRLRRATS